MWLAPAAPRLALVDRPPAPPRGGGPRCRPPRGRGGGGGGPSLWGGAGGRVLPRHGAPPAECPPPPPPPPPGAAGQDRSAGGRRLRRARSRRGRAAGGAAPPGRLVLARLLPLRHRVRAWPVVVGVRRAGNVAPLLRRPHPPAPRFRRRGGRVRVLLQGGQSATGRRPGARAADALLD